MMCFVLGKDQRGRDAGQAEGPILTMRQGSPQYVGGKGERRKIPQLRRGSQHAENPLLAQNRGQECDNPILLGAKSCGARQRVLGMLWGWEQQRRGDFGVFWWLFVPRRGEQTCCLLLGTSVLLGASFRGQWLRAAVSVSLNRRNSRTSDGCKLERKFHENRASHKDKTSKSHFLLSEKFTFFSAPKNKANKF